MLTVELLVVQFTSERSEPPTDLLNLYKSAFLVVRNYQHIVNESDIMQSKTIYETLRLTCSAERR